MQAAPIFILVIEMATFAPAGRRTHGGSKLGSGHMQHPIVNPGFVLKVIIYGRIVIMKSLGTMKLSDTVISYSTGWVLHRLWQPPRPDTAHPQQKAAP